MPSFIENVKLFKAPNGLSDTITVSPVRIEDVEFFKKHNYELSIEQLSTGKIAAYAMPPNGEDEDELVVIDIEDKGPLDTFQRLAKLCKQSLAQS